MMFGSRLRGILKSSIVLWLQPDFFPPNLQFNVNFSRGVNILFVYKILHAENLERHLNLGPTLKRKVPPSKRRDVLTVNRLTVVEDGQPLHFSSSYNSIAMCCLKDISRTVWASPFKSRYVSGCAKHRRLLHILVVLVGGILEIQPKISGVWASPLPLNHAPFCCFVRWKFLFSFSYTLELGFWDQIPLILLDCFIASVPSFILCAKWLLSQHKRKDPGKNRLLWIMLLLGKVINTLTHIPPFIIYDITTARLFWVRKIKFLSSASVSHWQIRFWHRGRRGK